MNAQATELLKAEQTHIQHMIDQLFDAQQYSDHVNTHWILSHLSRVADHMQSLLETHGTVPNSCDS